MSDHDPRPETFEELFARERAQVSDQPTDELRWQRIVRSAAQQRRTHRQRYAGAAAAVALLAAGVAWLAASHEAPAARTPAATAPAATHPVGRTPSPGPTSPAPAPTTARPTTPSQGGLAYGAPVPRDLTLLSMSNAGHGRLYAMGSGACSATQVCPVLVTSSDDGGSWSVVHAFTGSHAPAPGARPTPVQPGSVLSQVRFANPQVGWVFGGGAWSTRDGGRSWQPYPHPGDALVALESDGEQVAVVSGERCTADRCSGRMTLGVDSVSQPHGVAGGGASVDLGTGWADPVVALVAGQPVISAWTPVGGVVLQVTDTEALSPGTLGPVCRGGGSEVVTAAASAQPLLVGVCVTSGAAGTLGYAVSTSVDGTTWAPVSVDALLLVNAGHTSLAAADRSNLLAVSGGNPGVHGSMRVSHDGGRSWATPVGAPPMPELGWQWVGAPGGGTYYALDTAGPAYWVSHDRGDHWQRVVIH